MLSSKIIDRVVNHGRFESKYPVAVCYAMLGTIANETLAEVTSG
jgi:hypothetical protein